MFAHRSRGRKCALLAAGCLLLASAIGYPQTTVEPEIRVPLERYSISPYLQDSFLFLQGTTLPDMIKLDISLGLKFTHQPWRLFGAGPTGETEAPVENHVQFRPALSFAYRQWFDLAVVVPFAYQTAGTYDSLTTVSNPEGMHMLDPEIFVKIPLMHRRRAGFGFALGGQVVVPVGTTPFVNLGAFQSAVLVSTDWVWNNLAIMLNSGFLFRERVFNLNTTIGNEWFVRPGVAYRFPIGGYSLGIAAEGNIATDLENFFGAGNSNAFQLLFSVMLMPGEDAEGGMYAAVGGGSRLQGGGYGVPLANVDSRLGYSIQWGKRIPGRGAVAEAAPPDTAETTAETPSGEQPVEAAGEVATVTTPPADEATEVPGGEVPEPPSAFEIGGEEPIAAGGISSEGRVEAIRVSFSPNAPSVDALRSGSSEIPEAARAQVRANKTVISTALQRPGARLVVVGFADKCFEGPPPLGNQYNQELSQRRANAMVGVLREVLGPALHGVTVQTVAMGRTCANPACRCGSPDMAECANDRRVEVYIRSGGLDDIQCPGGRYWLAR